MERNDATNSRLRTAGPMSATAMSATAMHNKTNVLLSIVRLRCVRRVVFYVIVVTAAARVTATVTALFADGVTGRSFGSLRTAGRRVGAHPVRGVIMANARDPDPAGHGNRQWYGGSAGARAHDTAASETWLRRTSAGRKRKRRRGWRGGGKRLFRKTGESRRKKNFFFFLLF